MYVFHYASLVKVELPVAGAAKFEMCVVIRFLHAEGQPVIGILSNWSLKIKNEMPPSSLIINRAQLHFQPLGHRRSGFQGRKD